MVWAALAAAAGSGCAPVKTSTRVPQAAMRVAQEAAPAQLVERYNRIARGVLSVNATLELKPATGSEYTGVIEEYHDVKAFLLAARPVHVRIVGQAPVVAKNVFDMASDGETFRIFIPSKRQFIVGPARLEKPSKKPIENLRPEHLLDAIFWPEIAADETVLFEEFNDDAGRYYVLTILRSAGPAEIARKVWFDRADLQVARLQEFGTAGKLLSDIRFADWRDASEAETNAAPAALPLPFPRLIRLARPRDDYRLELTVTKLALNQEIAADRFRLEQPAGTDLVRVGDKEPGARP